MVTPYPHLMSPIKIGGLTLKNRIEAPPTSFMDASTEGLMNDRTIDFYRMRSKGGTALITLGEAYVDPERGLAHPCDLRLFEPLNMPGLVKAVEAIKQYGAVPSIELLHPGQRSDVTMNRSGKAYGPSPVDQIYAYDHPVYELTEEMILSPDLLVIAVGSQMSVPPFPGRDLPHVHTLADLAERNPDLGRRVVVIGGGLSGCEEALDLAQHGKQVVLLEGMDDILLTLGHDDYLHKKDLLDELENAETLTIHRKSRVVEITPSGVIADDAEGVRSSYEADSVVIACGTRPLEQTVNSFRNVGCRYAVIGDCSRARNLRSALQEGFLSVIDI